MSQKQDNGGCLMFLLDIGILIFLLKLFVWFFYQGGMKTL